MKLLLVAVAGCAMSSRATRALSALAMLVACGGPMTHEERGALERQNESALTRGLTKAGLVALQPDDASDGATPLGDPTPGELLHPTLGRVVVSIPRPDHVFAVDKHDVVHDVTVVTKVVRTMNVDVDGCDPRGRQGTLPMDPTRPIDPHRLRRYVPLAEGETLGAPMTIEIERVEIVTRYLKVDCPVVP